ncbi:MAG: hypothetical protein K8L99_32665 [Anaerolineae bacterium]|nr:hypothetical protein [Anaerolineae bacterium]
MSKRKNRKSSSPNLPQETLERARREAGLEPEVSEEEEVVEEILEEEAEEAEAEELDEPVAAKPKPSTTATRRRSSSAPSSTQRPNRSKRRRSVAFEEMSHDDIMERLAHPTKVVTTEELQRDYSYVTADLRSMAILAAVLFVALIVIAQVFVV